MQWVLTMNKAEILSQGDEVISGQTVDTNAAWLSAKLILMGFDVIRHTTVGDDVNALRTVMNEASLRSDLVINTGGLGPTADDLTAEVVASLSAQPLVFDEQAVEMMRIMFKRFGRKMVKANEKQAWLPAGAQRVDNHWGTAPGFSLSLNRAYMVFLPGVPSEMKKMFEASVAPRLMTHFDLSPGHLVIFRTSGAGESNLQEIIGHYQQPNTILSYRAMGREVQIKLRFSSECTEQDIHQRCLAMENKLGVYLFSVEGWGASSGGSLGTNVSRLLGERGLSIALAEGSSAGKLNQQFVNTGCAKAMLKGSICYHDNLSLAALLINVSEKHDLISDIGAKQVALSLRKQFNTELSLFTGPLLDVLDEEGVVVAKKSRLVLSTPNGLYSREQQVIGENESCQTAIMMTSLNFLRLWLMGELDTSLAV